MESDTTDPVLDALRSRRSVPRVTDEEPDRETVERVLEAASWAPNHYRTRPWRFVVLTGDARADLGQIFRESACRRAKEAGLPLPEQAVLEREARKPLRAPVVIVAACEPSDSGKAVEIEEIEAVAAAIENLLIAAHALGLGAMWRTGKPAYDPEVRRFLGLSPRASIVGFVYLGYPADVPLPERDHSWAQYVTWR